VIGFGGGILQTGPDVFGFKVGIVCEDFDFPHSGGEQVEHVLDPDAHAPDARPSAALVRVEGDPVHNGMIITYGGWRVKGAGNTPIGCLCRQPLQCSVTRL
jgi:hypothetical protein